MKYIGIFISKIIPTLLLIFCSSLIYAQESENDNQCLECHSDRSQLKPLTNQPEQYHISSAFKELSVHNEISCVGCHADPGGYPHPEVVGLAQCSSCHEIEADEYLSSPHGDPIALSLGQAPKCWDCHTLHLIRSTDDPISAMNRNNEWKVCSECHTAEDKEKALIGKFTVGIHSSVIKNDPTAESLSCSDCHGSHLLSKSAGEKWRSDHSSESEYCKECHEKESVDFDNSIHSSAIIMSNQGQLTLVCSDCHNEHAETPTEEKRNELSSQFVTGKCVECHVPAILDSRYALKARGYTPYLTSFHGVRNLSSEIVFTNCASCHGIHEIEAFMNTDTNSKINMITNKCGECHPAISVDLANSRVHLSVKEPVETEIYYSRIVMKLIIGLTLLLISITIVGDIYKVIGRKGK